MPQITDNRTLALLAGHRETAVQRLAGQHARNDAARVRAGLRPLFSTQPTKEAPKVDVPTGRDLLPAFVALVEQVPDGFYALPKRDSDEVTFFEVRTEGTGRGKRNWVYQLQGAPGDFTRIKLSYLMMFYAARHLAEDARAAAILFGRRTRTCGICNSPLTNPASLAKGIGPKCERKFA